METGKKLIYNILFFSTALLLALTSCNKKSGTSSETNTPVEKTTEKTNEAALIKDGFVKASIIDKTGLDGCSFMIKLENELLLESNSIKEEFKKDSLKIWVKYIPKKGAMSICMSGKMVDIVAIKLR